MPKQFSIIIFAISFCFYGCHKDNPVAPVTPPPTGIGGIVYALATYNSDLVVGGNFGSAGQVSAQNIALWNGNNWSALGALGNANTFVVSLAVYRAQLIAGLSDGSIMQWNGAAWTSIGKVFSSRVSIGAFTEYNGNLIVCGGFDSVTGAKANNIAVWNGISWSALGLGINAAGSSLAVYNQNLIVANYNNVEQWNGTSWVLLGKTDTNTAVQSLYTDTINNTLITVGTFNSIGGVVASIAAQWNGTTWVALDKTYDVYSGLSIDIFKGNLVVVGEYGDISSLSGNTWTLIGRTQYTFLPEGSGAPGHNYAGVVWNGNLYVAGDFVACNGVTANSIVRWNGSAWSAF